MMKYVVFFSLLGFFIPTMGWAQQSIEVAAVARPQIAIIIDDLGYHLQRGQATIALPGAITVAVIPHTPHAKRLANLAHIKGREVMLHMPMQSINHSQLDVGGLTVDMDKEEFVSTVKKNLTAVPHIKGVNNHMGSLLTSQPQQMNWLMSELINHPLFFIDSKTTETSVAARTAKSQRIPTRSRNIFLDNERSLMPINQQFNQLIKLAREQGDAIGIGHPNTATLEYLTAVLPLLAAAGIDLVAASELVPGYKAISDVADALETESAPQLVLMPE